MISVVILTKNEEKMIADAVKSADWADEMPRYGAVRADLQPAVANRAREAFDVSGHFGAGARQADVGGVDAEPVHAVEEVDLLLDGRRADRRRLQPVAQRLIVEHRHGTGTGGIVVPVVDQRMRGDTHGATCGLQVL